MATTFDNMDHIPGVGRSLSTSTHGGLDDQTHEISRERRRASYAASIGDMSRQASLRSQRGIDAEEHERGRPLSQASNPAKRLSRSSSSEAYPHELRLRDRDNTERPSSANPDDGGVERRPSFQHERRLQDREPRLFTQSDRQDSGVGEDPPRRVNSRRDLPSQQQREEREDGDARAAPGPLGGSRRVHPGDHGSGRSHRASFEGSWIPDFPQPPSSSRHIQHHTLVPSRPPSDTFTSSTSDHDLEQRSRRPSLLPAPLFHDFRRDDPPSPSQSSSGESVDTSILGSDLRRSISHDSHDSQSIPFRHSPRRASSAALPSRELDDRLPSRRSSHRAHAHHEIPDEDGGYRSDSEEHLHRDAYRPSSSKEEDWPLRTTKSRRSPRSSSRQPGLYRGEFSDPADEDLEGQELRRGKAARRSSRHFWPGDSREPMLNRPEDTKTAKGKKYWKARRQQQRKEKPHDGFEEEGKQLRSCLRLPVFWIVVTVAVAVIVIIILYFVLGWGK
ncbi:hypothetical protein JCM11641_001998 [Rhodosporidiobolus odoratus]